MAHSREVGRLTVACSRKRQSRAADARRQATLNSNYEIVDGIHLVQSSHEPDLHNDFIFQNLDYSVAERKLDLNWDCSKGQWVSEGTPNSVTIEFNEVREFRFMPRDSKFPFTEDDCISSFGYWVDEDWVEGVIMVAPNQKAEPHWLDAIEFMSGAVIAIQADSANAKIVA